MLHGLISVSWTHFLRCAQTAHPRRRSDPRTAPLVSLRLPSRGRRWSGISVTYGSLGFANRISAPRIVLTLLACCAAVFPAQAQTPVSAQALSELSFALTREAPAQVVALSDSLISAEISAPVKAINAEVGATAERGELLAELDCRDYDLQARELEAQQSAIQARLRFAEGQLRRARSLQQQRTISEELAEQRLAERDALRAEQTVIEASLQRVARNRERCRIQAPFGGVIIERLIDTGEYLTPGTPAFRMLAQQRVELTANVPLADLAGLERSSQIWLRTVVGDYPVRLRSVLPLLDVSAQTQQVRLQFTEASAPAGAAGRLVWQSGLHLPARVLIQREDQFGVFLAINGRATFQALPDVQEGRPAPIDNVPGLTPDSLVIIDGAQGLQHGDEILLAP